jgi:hypothetical protein
MRFASMLGGYIAMAAAAVSISPAQMVESLKAQRRYTLDDEGRITRAIVGKHKTKQAKPKKRPNRATISARVRRKHRRAA